HGVAPSGPQHVVERQHRAEGVAIGDYMARQGHLAGGADERGGGGEVLVQLPAVVGMLVHSPSEWSWRRISSTRSPVFIAGSSRNTSCGVYFMRTWRPIAAWRLAFTARSASAVSCSASPS